MPICDARCRPGLFSRTTKSEARARREECGNATHYFEVNDYGDAVRQLSLLPGGVVLAYTEAGWSDSSGFLLTESWLRLGKLDPLAESAFQTAWDSARPTNTPSITQIRPPVPAHAEEMTGMVEQQLSALPWPDAASSIRRHLVVPPVLHWRRWDYGEHEERLCWLVASWPERGWGIAYCGDAHAFDWGIVDLNSPWFGGDSSWWGLFIEAVFQAGSIERPSGYQRWVNTQPTWQQGSEVAASQDEEDLMDGVHLD